MLVRVRHQPPDPVTPQRCCPARGTLQAISKRVETQPLLRLSLAILTIGSLLSIAIVNLVGPGRGDGGPWRGALLGSFCVCFLGAEEPILGPGHLQVSNPVANARELQLVQSQARPCGAAAGPFGFHTRT